MSKTFIQASRLFLSTCLASMLVLSACGGGSSESGSQAPANSDQATPVSAGETWSMVESTPPINTVGAPDFVLWNGTPETLPADTLASSTWWLQDRQSGAYLPGLGKLQAFASSLYKAEGTTLFLVKDGQIFQVDIRQAPNWQPIRVSSINNAASIEASFQDSTGQTVLRVKTLSDTLVVIKPNAAMTDVPQPLPVSTVYELHAFWDANGRLQGRLVIDRDKWELALLSDDETRVLQHFPLPESLDRAARPAQWIGPQWKAHAGVMQIGQGLYRFDWRGPIATLSSNLHTLREMDSHVSNHQYVADDTQLYVSDGADIVSFGPSGPVSIIPFAQDRQDTSGTGMGDMLLTSRTLLIHERLNTGIGQIRVIDRQTNASTAINPTEVGRSIRQLLWADDTSIGFLENGSGANHLVRWTTDGQYATLAVNPYVFERSFETDSASHTESGFSHHLRFIGWEPQPPYKPDWTEPLQYPRLEPAHQVWWCDSTENFASRRMCDPRVPIHRYDVGTKELTEQGRWPVDAHIGGVWVDSSGLAAVLDYDVVDERFEGMRTSLWRLDTSGNAAPFFLSAQVLNAWTKDSAAAPARAEASSLTLQSKSE